MRASCLISFFLTSFASFGADPVNVPIEKLGDGFELIGKLHAPLGKMISVAGVVVEGDFKGYEGGLNLRVQRIQGRYYQDDIQIVLEEQHLEWDDDEGVDEDALRELKVGETYEMEGYETGGFVGIPREALDRMAGIPQTTSHYFRHQFVVIKAKRIEAISYSPQMFSDVNALIAGVARSVEGDSVLAGDDWLVVVKRGEKWADDMEGKRIEAYGLYKPDVSGRQNANLSTKKFDLLDGWCRLVALEDQIGRKVSLRGKAWIDNGVWSFHYRGTELYVDGMDELPGWTIENSWRPIEVEGTLDRGKRSSLDQRSLQRDSDLADYFIVRDPSWKPLPALLAPERAFPPKP